jgi:hypothetical protein
LDASTVEQARDRPVDRRADIFSFGIVLYEMFAGVNPFRGETQIDTLAAITMTDPGPVSARRSGIPSGVDELVARMVEKDPDHRIGSMGSTGEPGPAVGSVTRIGWGCACPRCGARSPQRQIFCAPAGVDGRDATRCRHWRRAFWLNYLKCPQAHSRQAGLASVAS